MTDPSDHPFEPDDLVRAVELIDAGDTTAAARIVRQAFEAIPVPGKYPQLLILAGDLSFASARPVEAATTYAAALRTYANSDYVPTERDLAIIAELEAKRAIAISVSPPGSQELTMAVLDQTIQNLTNHTHTGVLNPALARVYLAQSVVAARMSGGEEDTMPYLEKALLVCDANDRQLVLQIYIARAAAALRSGNREAVAEEIQSCDELLERYDRSNKWLRQRVLVAMLTVDFADSIINDPLAAGTAWIEGHDINERMPQEAQVGLVMEYRLLTTNRRPPNLEVRQQP